jgi:cobalt-zinc-cadmium efflux system membrane fusion protein
MKHEDPKVGLFLFAIFLLLTLGGCNSANGDPAAEAPPPATVVPVADPSLFTVDHPEQFPLTAATERTTTSELVVTGSAPRRHSKRSRHFAGYRPGGGDSRATRGHRKEGPVIADHSQRRCRRRLLRLPEGGLRRSPGAQQLERGSDLYKNGANSLNDLQVAEDAEKRANIDVETTAEHLRLLGNDPDHPEVMVDLYASVAGVSLHSRPVVSAV